MRAITSARRWLTRALAVQAPARAGADLAQLLVQARALAVDVGGGGAGKAREQARTCQHGAAAVIAQARGGRRQAGPRYQRAAGVVRRRAAARA